MFAEQNEMIRNRNCPLVTIKLKMKLQTFSQASKKKKTGCPHCSMICQHSGALATRIKPKHSSGPDNRGTILHFFKSKRP